MYCMIGMNHVENAISLCRLQIFIKFSYKTSKLVQSVPSYLDDIEKKLKYSSILYFNGLIGIFFCVRAFSQL